MCFLCVVERTIQERILWQGRASAVRVLEQNFEDIDAECKSNRDGVSFAGVEPGFCEGFKRFGSNVEDVFSREAVKKLSVEELGSEIFFLNTVSECLGQERELAS